MMAPTLALKTVADLIDFLGTLPADTPVLIDVPSQTDGGSYLFELDPPAIRHLDESEARQLSLPEGVKALIIR